jgi:hypothetical protein
VTVVCYFNNLCSGLVVVFGLPVADDAHEPLIDGINIR